MCNPHSFPYLHPCIFCTALPPCSAVVSDTATQRRVAELLIDNVHWFFPDLPDTPVPTPLAKQPAYNSSHGINPSGTYTPTGPLSSYATPPPTSPAASTPSSSTSSSITEDLQSQTSPSQTTPPIHVPHETLTEIRASSPKPGNTASPPIRPKPYRGSGAVNSGSGGTPSTPPSPSPRSGSFTCPHSSEISNCTPVAEPTDSIGEGGSPFIEEFCFASHFLTPNHLLMNGVLFVVVQGVWQTRDRRSQRPG